MLQKRKLVSTLQDGPENYGPKPHFCHFWMFESQGVLIWALGVSVQLVLSGDLEHVSGFHARNIEMANRTHKIGGKIKCCSGQE